MTELERQLTRALRELSAQYEREQERQAGLIEGLSKQISQLGEQVRRLAEDYEGLASDYRALARLCGIRSGGSRRR